VLVGSSKTPIRCDSTSPISEFPWPFEFSILYRLVFSCFLWACELLQKSGLTHIRKFSCHFERFCDIFSSVFQNLMSATWMIKIGQIVDFSIKNHPQACCCWICFNFFGCDLFQSTCVIATDIFTLYMFHVYFVIIVQYMTNCISSPLSLWQV